MEKEIEDFNLKDVSNAEDDLDQLVSAANAVVNVLNAAARKTDSFSVRKFRVNAGEAVIRARIKHGSNEAAEIAAEIISCKSISVEDVSTAEYTDNVTYHVEIDPEEW